jgi:hypothetical protein
MWKSIVNSNVTLGYNIYYIYSTHSWVMNHDKVAEVSLYCHFIVGDRQKSKSEPIKEK